ncbi:MAG: hypothetical protein IPK75_18785 [Acidobacteria bacterium]|nr:hypothetical protein [Acidobacteriota bacterium]
MEKSATFEVTYTGEEVRRIIEQHALLEARAYIRNPISVEPPRFSAAYFISPITMIVTGAAVEQTDGDEDDDAVDLLSILPAGPEDPMTRMDHPMTPLHDTYIVPDVPEGLDGEPEVRF